MPDSTSAGARNGTEGTVARIDAKTRRKAFRLRLAGKSIAEAARECGIARATLRRHERGWRDHKGVFHEGWRGQIERLRREQEEHEVLCGLSLKEERIKTYERLARRAVELIERDFPNIKMKNASDAKALLSEVRELCRLISIERGEYRPKGEAFVGVKIDVARGDLEERYRAAQEVEVEEVEPPREARPVPTADAEDEAALPYDGTET